MAEPSDATDVRPQSWSQSLRSAPLGVGRRPSRSVRRGLSPVALLVLISLMTAPLVAAERASATQATHGVVVAVSPDAADAGLRILKRGGTAVDAAVATALAMAVTYPPAGNIGGGGFMMVCPGNGVDPVCVEYRERAPAAATRDMFALGASRFGHKIVGVPGTVAGLALAHQRYGRLPWKDLVQPAVDLAIDGFLVDAALARSLNQVRADKRTRPFKEFLRVYRPPDGTRWRDGDRMRQPDLGRTLRWLADDGPDAFYRGRIAKLIVAEMAGSSGVVTAEDLADYQAKLRTPIHTRYRGFDVYGPPPPSSGGICLIEMLNILENFDLRQKGRWSAETNHLMIEAMRRAYLDRARFLGDQDFVQIPDRLTRKSYAAQLAAKIAPRRATDSAQLGADIPLAPAGASTTHFSVIDARGMAVSNTYTLEYSYGSRVVVKGGGFLLNNEMGDFNWKAGHTDRLGRIGTDANLIQPGKRMLSSQCPTLVTRDGRVRLVTGSPGGRTIINTALCIVLNLLEFEMDPVAAVAAPRLHHQWLPDRVRFEDHNDADYRRMLDVLRAWGHSLEKRPRRQGDAHTIWVDPKTGKYTGVADHRISGKAAGY